MKNKVSWKSLIGGAVIAYFLEYVIGGVIGNAFGILGFLFLVVGIIDLIRELSHSSKQNKQSSNQ